MRARSDGSPVESDCSIPLELWVFGLLRLTLEADYTTFLMECFNKAVYEYSRNDYYCCSDERFNSFVNSLIHSVSFIETPHTSVEGVRG